MREIGRTVDPARRAARAAGVMLLLGAFVVGIGVVGIGVVGIAGVASPAVAQDTPKGIDGSTPGLDGGDGPGRAPWGADPKGADPKGADSKGMGPDKVGMPPGGGMPPDKRAAPPTVAGAYSLVGRNLNGSSYRGRVAVTATGETYRVVWRVGTQTFVGTGILTGDILSVAYNGGLAVYRFSPQGIRGRWATTNATRIATEDWTRR